MNQILDNFTNKYEGSVFIQTNLKMLCVLFQVMLLTFFQPSIHAILVKKK